MRKRTSRTEAGIEKEERREEGTEGKKTRRREQTDEGPEKPRPFQLRVGGGAPAVICRGRAKASEMGIIGPA